MENPNPSVQWFLDQKALIRPPESPVPPVPLVGGAVPPRNLAQSIPPSRESSSGAEDAEDHSEGWNMSDAGDLLDSEVVETAVDVGLTALSGAAETLGEVGGDALGAIGEFLGGLLSD